MIYGHYSVMEHKLLPEITHNMRVKTFPDGTKIFECASAPIYRETGWELSDKWDSERGSVVRNSSEDVARAKRRAAAKIFDIAFASDFTYFVTLTLDQQRVDRYDMSEITRRLNSWLDNRVRRNGLTYVLVPERHQDGAIHFHGFFNDALPVVSSGTYDVPGSSKPRKPRSAAQRREWLEQGAREVFNLPSWTLGFTTAIELYGSKRAAVRYVCKYVTKADEKIGGRWYYSGGALRYPSVELFDADFSDIESVEGASGYRIDRLGVDILSWEVRGD